MRLLDMSLIEQWPPSDVLGDRRLPLRASSMQFVFVDLEI
jgi:hypothetical protein